MTLKGAESALHRGFTFLWRPQGRTSALTGQHAVSVDPVVMKHHLPEAGGTGTHHQGIICSVLYSESLECFSFLSSAYILVNFY